MRRATAIVLAIATVALLATVAAGCGAVRDDLEGIGCGTSAKAHRACLAETGFAPADGVTLVAVDKEEGMDTAISFTLQGPPKAIDEVLATAGFTTRLVPGKEELTQVADDADLSNMTGVVSGDDRWTDPAGVHFDRQVLRATPGDHPKTDVLYVYAFTT